jgi:SMI1-KNR4 cell-wall
MGKAIENFDVEQFWEPSEYATEAYVGSALTDETVAAVERELGYRLPASYVELMRIQNGGIPFRTNHRTTERTSWAEDHIAVSGIYSIGSEKRYSLCGDAGSRFWVEKWGYPDIGIYFADCPSAGHDMVCLDYRACGPSGEPQVVHIDQEWDYKIVFVAVSFEAFIRGLEDDSAFE